MDSTVRFSTTDDMPELLRMCRAFYDASGYADMGEFDATLMESVLGGLIDAETLLIADGGMIGWVNFPVFMTGQQVSQELFWWVDKDKRTTGVGKELLQAAEQAAKTQGSRAMMMLCLDNLNGDKVAAMYANMGYEPRERTFMRAL